MTGAEHFHNLREGGIVRELAPGGRGLGAATIGG
jgi:hypothetical protein